MVVRIGDLRPIDLHKTGARSDQRAGQEATLSEGSSAIAIPQRRRFLGKVEGIASPARDYQAECLAVIFIQVVLLDRLLQGRHAAVDLLAQPGPPLQAM